MQRLAETLHDEALAVPGDSVVPRISGHGLIRGRARLEKWTGDRDRCRAAGIGDDVVFATKPQLAQKMIERAVTAGVPFAWVASDEVYGQNPGLRAALENDGISYVMAVPCSEQFALPRTYAPPGFITDRTGRHMIPLTAAEARRQFNLHTRITRPAAFHEHWSDLRRYRQAAAHKSHYARRTRNLRPLL